MTNRRPVSATSRKRVAGVLRRALKRMNDSGAHWTKNTFVDTKGPGGTERYCSVGALNRVLEGNPEFGTLREQALQELAYGLPTAPHVDGVWSAQDKVISWNDNEKRQWKDIVARFNRTIERLEKTK